LSDGGFLAGIGRIWADIHIASPLSVTVISGYIIWAVVLMISLPGPTVEGPMTPNSNVPRYRDNGFACYVLTMISFALLAILLPLSTQYSVTIVYDRFDEFLGKGWGGSSHGPRAGQPSRSHRTHPQNMATSY